MKLNLASLSDKTFYEKTGVRLPRFDVQKMRAETLANPVWVHFGAGNIFRGFIAKLQQTLLENGLATCGILAAETFDYEVIDKMYTPFDSLSLLVTLNPDGSTQREIVASVADGIRADSSDEAELSRLKAAFANSSLQMVSFTITEKGYALRNMQGQLLPVVESDLADGPSKARHAMSLLTALMAHRFQNGAYPIALVSMDNCSHNGEKLRNSMLEIAEGWQKNGFVSADFVAYLSDESKVAFPWSMIDKITPRPDASIAAQLKADGFEDMDAVVTGKNTYIAPFVNAEAPEYLVVEDRFPGGRPALEKAGVYMTDRDTVNNTERMKVTTCLNPLHTALAVTGCLLGHKTIAAEMQDEDLVKLVHRIGYDEGMPVVVHPGIIDPAAFLNEVITQRLPNPYIPDMPQRIATDTSQKIPIRFGETIKSYVASDTLNAADLQGIPFAIAAWLRYLLGVNDNGEAMEISSDPMLPALKEALSGIELGKPESCQNQLDSILTNTAIFGTDLKKAGLADKVTHMLREMLAGPGAVRATLRKYA